MAARQRGVQLGRPFFVPAGLGFLGNAQSTRGLPACTVTTHAHSMKNEGLVSATLLDKLVQAHPVLRHPASFVMQSWEG